VLKFSVFAFLCASWLGLHQAAARIDPRQTYHVASAHRDRRRARFYLYSVWTGLIAAFVCYGSLEAFTSSAFDTTLARQIVSGVLRGVGLWGLLVIGLVWARVGQRAGDATADRPAFNTNPYDGPRGRN
jgi:hypothetical protein